MKKVAFLLISNISLHDTQVYWNNIFSVSSKGISLANNILNTVNYLWLCTYIKLEAAVPSFSLNSCSKTFRKFTRKKIVAESFFS